MLLIAVDVEMLAATCGLVGDCLIRKIHLHLRLRIMLDAGKELCQEVVAHLHGQHEIVQFVVFVDISEKRADDHPEAIACNRPGSMLARAATAEVLACHEDTTAIGGIVEHKVLIQRAVGLVAPIAKQVVAKETFLPGGSLQESGGDNLVCVHILQWKGHTCTGYNVEFLFHNVLGSVITPVMAAAAATNGLARMVLAPGPCRPSKLRLLVLTLSLPAGILSSFIAKQAEHPGWRISKPASTRILSRPSSRICLSTAHEPGTSQATTSAAF